MSIPIYFVTALIADVFPIPGLSTITKADNFHLFFIIFLNMVHESLSGVKSFIKLSDYYLILFLY